jgi:tRNA G18 (ribose-2'-O)-methylase SpoU
LIVGLQLFCQNKGALKTLFRVLPAMPRPQGAGGDLFDAPTLSGLRWTLLAQSYYSSRLSAETIQRQAARLLHVMQPLRPERDSLPMLGHVLATLPSVVCMDSVVGSATASTSTVAYLPVFEELVDWAAQAPQDELAACLAEGVAEYCSGTWGGSTQVPMTAVALARLLVLSAPSLGAHRLSTVLRPLADVLSTVHSHAYLPPLSRARALMLLRALLAVAWPAGGNADVHLNRVVAGSGVPLGWGENSEPLHAEWVGVNRACDTLFPSDLAFVPTGEHHESIAAVTDTVGATPCDDVEEAIRTLQEMAPSSTQVAPLMLLREAVRTMLSPEHVSSEVASVTQGALMPGLRLTDGLGGVWGPDHPEGGPRRDTDSFVAVPRLTTTFYLALLRDSIRACPASSAFRTAVCALVTTSASRLPDVGAGGGLPEPTVAVQQAHALHVLAVLTAVLLPYVPTALETHDSNGLATPGAGLELVRRLMGSALRRPAGVIDPALPLHLSGTPGDDPGSASLVEIRWLSVRSLAERARWAAMDALLRHGTEHGWGARGEERTSIARLPVEVAEELASAVCDAISSVGNGPGELAIACTMAAHVIAYTRGEGEEAGEVDAALRRGGAGRAAHSVSGTSLESLLLALAGQVWTARPSRRDLLAYTSAVMHPLLFARPGLHDRGAPLMSHLVRAWAIMSDDSHAPLCAQVFAARLCAIYSRALLSESSTVSRAVLGRHAPFLVALLMHREFVLPWEDAGLVDTHSRAQMMAWLQARGEGTAGYWQEACLPVVEALAVEPSRPPRVDPATVLSSRGAGAVTRVQALACLELATARAQEGSEVARDLVHAVALQLARLNVRPDWLREIPAGSPQHAARLRAWQALALIAGSIGAQAGSAEADASGLVYDAGADMWLPPAGQEGAAVTRLHEDAVTMLGCEAEDGGSAGGAAAAPLAPGERGRRRAKAASPKTVVKDANMPGPFAMGMQAALPSSPPASTTAAILLLAALRCALSTPQTPSLRHYIEVAAVALSRRFPVTSARMLLLPMLRDFNPRAQRAFSLLLISADTVRHVAAVAAAQSTSTAGVVCASLGRALLSSIFPFLTSPVGLCRLLAHVAVDDAVPLLFGPTSAIDEDEQAGLRAWVMPMLDLVRGCSEVSTMVLKARAHLRRVDPRRACALRFLLSSPVTEHGELVPRDAFSTVRATFQSLTSAQHHADTLAIVDSDCVPLHIKAAVAQGLLPALAMLDCRLRVLAAGPVGEGSASKEAVFVYQRKVLSALSDSEAASTRLSGGEEAYREAVAGVIAGAFAPDEAGAGQAARAAFTPRASHPLLTERGPGGRLSQPLIVIASLVSKAANLGGLARTCEIFSVGTLCVRDLRIREDQQFKDLAVTAGEWMPLVGVPHDTPSLRAYLRAQKAAGYTVVALEQASRSVALGSPAAALPPRTVLLLGAEKEGVPSDLLSEVDVIIEVPQTGVVRSLNVHVSAALVIWEYTRQRLSDAA